MKLLARGPGRVGLLAIVLGLAACQLPNAGISDSTPRPRVPMVKPAASKSPAASVQSSPSPSPSASVAASPSASPSASVAPSTLQKPAGTIRVISGTVSIDAHYAAASGGGRILGNNGAQTIAFGDTALIGNNGSNIISDNGASLIGKVKAPIAGLVANNGSNYRVAQLGGTVALGEVLPAAGLAIRAFALRTGEILPIGADGAGKPVYEVYSDAQGKYQLYLPETAIDNVLVQAFVPARADKRLDLRLVVPEAVAPATIDEDTALVSDFIRRAFASNMEADLTIYAESATIEEAVVKDTGIYSSIFREPLMAMRRKLFTAAEQAGVKGYSPARRKELAQRITDAALANMDLPNIMTTYARQKLTTPDEPALGALAKLLAESRLRVRDKMRSLVAEGKDIATFFGEDEIVKTVNASTTPPFVIRTPTEGMEFFVFGVAVNPQMPGAESGVLMERIEANPNYNMAPGTIDRMLAATRPIEEAYLKTFYLDEAASKDAVAAIAAGVP